MDLLRSNKKWIMEEWQARVCKTIPASHNQSRLALYDSLPDFLDNLSDQINHTIPIENELALAKENLIGKVHGQHRANNSYSIDQMIDEYFVLKDVVIELYKREKALTEDIRDIIARSFQKALQISAAQFSKSLLASQEEFVLTVAHDLRSPLMVIKMQAGLMERKKVFDSKNTGKIHASADKIDRMIEHLLDMIKLNSSPATEVNSQEFDLCILMSEVASGYEEAISNPVVIECESTMVHWDRQAFERVIDNLVSNASKYGDPEKPITIKVRSDQTNVFLSVHNYGDPIPAEEQIHLFQKFRRSKNNHHKTGWGIGLSYVKTVVEKHKGIVLVNSDEKGTIFKFELPRNLKISAQDGLAMAKNTEPNTHVDPIL